jgi:hypothetical protein
MIAVVCVCDSHPSFASWDYEVCWLILTLDWTLVLHAPLGILEYQCGIWVWNNGTFVNERLYVVALHICHGALRPGLAFRFFVDMPWGGPRAGRCCGLSMYEGRVFGGGNGYSAHDGDRWCMRV